MNKEDQILKKLLNEASPEAGPRLDFSANIMRKIDEKQRQKNTPIIGKIGWSFVILFLGTILIYTAIYSNPSNNIFPSLIADLNELLLTNSAIYALTIFFVTASLIGIDELFKRRRHKKKQY